MARNLSHISRTLVIWYFTCGHEGGFNGGRGPVWMDSLNISSCTTRVRTRHGCARNYVEFDTPGVVRVDGRWCHGRPSSKNVHSMGGKIRLQNIQTRLLVYQLMRVLRRCKKLRTLGIQSISHLENVWGDGVWSFHVSPTKIVAIGFLWRVFII